MVIPSRRRGGMTNKWLTWTLLLLYTSTSVNAVSPHQKVPGSVVASGSDPPLSASSRSSSQAGRSPAEIPQLTHNIPNKFRNTNEDAGKYDNHALAPASLQPAVRAPQQSIESQALSQQDGARRLLDWEADDIVLLATIDGALHARDRKSGRRRWELKMPEPMIEAVHYTQNKSGTDELQMQDDYIFIVEPSGDGQLYAQFADPRVGLIKLPATVRKMATEVPSMMQLKGQWLDVTSQQESRTYTIDAQTGQILNEFPRTKSSIRSEPQPRCRPRSGLDFEDSACRPGRTLRLGRNTYTFTISKEETGQDLCTIRFSDWVTNKLDHDLQSQHINSLDNYDVRVGRNGLFHILDVSADQDHQARHYGILDSPVARVFDVARRVDEEDDSADLILLSRSADFIPSKDIALLKQDPLANQRVFINQTQSGQWYALSEQNYPGVTYKAKLANVAHNWFNEPLDLHGDMKDIIGVHLLSNKKLDGQQLTISEQAFSNSDETTTDPEKAVTPPGPIYTEQLIRQTLFKQIWHHHHVVAFCAVMALAAASLAYLGLLTPVMQLLKLTPSSSRTTVTPQVIQSGGVQAEQAAVADPPVVTETVHADDLVQVESSSADGNVVTPSRSRAQSTVLVVSPKKDKEENDSDGDSEEENEVEDASEKKKKKTKRGARGGRGRRKNKGGDSASFEPKPMISQEKHLRDGFVQVGRLTYDGKLDSCLGQGSSGTAVFPGTFDGRVVAVKRLVKTANSLAEKEIRHLVNSDSHANVIRYHGKEESPTFFYIALDKFDTSLDRFVEFPNDFPSLVCPTKGYDVKDALKQITQGVQHLHSLKLVHRDIKPQNILVRPVKSNRPVTGLTPLLFVISDFGLCKPLEDGPESVFAATRTAAGTTGWKAPELLVSSRDAIAAPIASIESTQSTASKTHTASSSVSENGTTIDPPTGRRATKAIDIFSLGCVFFYVLTRGAHPFDRGGSPLARDLNIKEDKYDTSLLRDSFVSYDYDADDLIMQMIMHDPKSRPDTAGILAHPYFWQISHKLDFICSVSDAYEERKQKINNIHDENAVRTDEELRILEELAALQDKAPNVIGKKKDGTLQSFLDALPRSFLAEMGKQRKYTGTKMIDLLRVIRNKKNHFHSLPYEVQEMMKKSVDNTEGARSSIEGYYAFWRDKFPSLLVNCHQLLQERDLIEEFGLERYYDGSMSR